MLTVSVTSCVEAGFHTGSFGEGKKDVAFKSSVSAVSLLNHSARNAINAFFD